MSVMECDREGCPEIMCHRLILNGTRYICGYCWSELVDYKATWELPMTEGEVEQRIRDFMETQPRSTIPVEEHHDIDEVFRRLTGQEDA